MPFTITNPYRLRIECLRNVSPGCADLAGRITVALRTEILNIPTATLMQSLFDHLDAIAAQHSGSVTRLGIWMCSLVHARVLLIHEVEIFLSDATAIGGASSSESI
ncbi:hypothetical protein BI292_01305 [Pseudomonas sp. 43NM1]|uniref:hypothetical protein n=1 Tax=unclassified Pseudomonas TaxID=196821 RepID=UPI000C33FB91|nr:MULTISPECIES: hypothetical protein [unclassified Pseudomonas]KAA0986193.1 hypothetical protein FQ192_23850 [Pseudomonas sp. ANT_J12]PKH39680.1 hypothetical protein BI292_01305 [Pseudomonas sp. 43NM1]